MSNYDRNAAGPGISADRATTVDAGLRAYMLRVYNYMAAGVGLTGLVAMLTYQFTGPALLQSPLMWVLHIGASGAGVLYQFPYQHAVGGSRASDCSSSMRRWSDCRFRQSFTSTPAVLDHARVLHFGRDLRSAQHLGLHHPRDLSGFGTFLFMGLIGIVIASLVNLFLRSSGLDWVISIIGVGVFAGLTAYDTQRIKGMYDRGDDATVGGSQGRDGRALAISRLHQPVHDDAAPGGQPALSAIVSEASKFERPCLHADLLGRVLTPKVLVHDPSAQVPCSTVAKTINER